MLFLQAGPEIAVVATKTFVTQVTTLVLLAAAVAKARGRSTRAASGSWWPRSGRCRRRPSGRSTAPRRRARLARRYVNSRGFMFVGRGVTYPVALEGALKLKEVSYVHAEGYAAGELKHGPISLLDAEVPAGRHRHPLVAPGQAHQQRHGGPRPGCPGDRGRDRGRRDRALRRRHLWVPDTLEALSPVLAIIPLQLFAYHMAIARGTDVDQPRNLAKSVTVE